MITWIIVAAAAGLVLGTVLGWLVLSQRSKKSVESSKRKSEQVLLDARSQALKIKEEAEKEREKRQGDIKELEQSLRRREESLDRRSETLEKDRSGLASKEKEIEAIRNEMSKIAEKKMEEIQKISGLKKEDAKAILLKEIEKEFEEDLLSKIRQYKVALKEQSEVEARKILSTVINRYANEVASEHTTMSVILPNEEMKGR